jgi:7-cyano-7-deazaguanine synthase
MSPKNAVILLSGGLDSATCLAIAKSENFSLYALSFRYGQRHHTELEAAKATAQRLGVVKHQIVDIDLRQFGGSALTADIEVPKDRSAHEMEQGIPITYVPARNTIFLSYALAYAEVLQSWDIFIGINAVDFSGYPDCRPAFIEAYEKMSNLALAAAVEGKGKLTIHSPLLHLTKAQIIQRGMALGVEYGLTHSCYDPDEEGLACGRCDSCSLRKRGFQEAGVKDPTRYVKAA